jgi:uncharacterized protein (TIGR03067 family)
MSHRTLFVLALAPLLAVAALGADDAKKDLDKLQGEWSTVSAVVDGEALPDSLVAALKFSIKDDKIVIKGDEEVVKMYAKGALKLDPSTTPKSVDFKAGEGSEKGAVIEGIYELKGDEFRICAKLAGKDRPTEFASKEGTQTVLIVLKRDKN